VPSVPDYDASGNPEIVVRPDIRKAEIIDASMATHNGITPGYRYESSLRKFSLLTSNSHSSKGSLFADLGKEGEDLGKLLKKSSRNAPDNDDHF
jgi:hypothetical protein